MNIITLVTLTLSLLLVNADNQYCDNLLNNYSAGLFGVPIKTCCDLRVFPPSSVPSGVYKMSTDMGSFTITNVYCDMSAKAGGGWIVIQRNRVNSELSFDKNWREYEDGFGDLNNDFWAGLKLMNTLTQTGQWEMRVDYQKNDKTWSYLHYNQFSVGNSSEKYQLIVEDSELPGDVTNYFTSHNGMKFSSPDNDNDIHSDLHCANYKNSGWWYFYCRHVNLNEQPPHVGGNFDVLFSEMKIRPKDCTTLNPNH